MAYVDGFLLALKTKNLKAYQKMSKTAGKIWRSHGALDYREFAGDDLKIPGMANTFPKLLKCGKSETVIFAYILYKSRAHRDKANAKVMKDPRMDKFMKGPMPFDMKRMWMGGFKGIVEA
jgi:uncharacterized protein YbaA (DUF1428 family)